MNALSATLSVHDIETVEQRVLGALRCVDAWTGAAITTPLQVECTQGRLLRNRSGLFVVWRADGLAAHEAAFSAPPALPAVGSVNLDLVLRDPSGLYLPRRARLALPRDSEPGRSANPGSLFRAQDLPLYPSSRAPLGANWAVLRVQVANLGAALGGALLTVRSGARVLARALSDNRGEALLAVAGVPVTTWSNAPGAVLVNELAAELEVVFDPAVGSRGNGSAQALVDPDDLEARRLALPRLTQAIGLRAARQQSLSMSLVFN